tara:strand:+ start:5334 stop:6212 length:879 start_codon:yes stop_codon:yes gene_type:complete
MATILDGISGRFCNQIFRGCCVSLLAEKNNLMVIYKGKYFNEIINILGLKLFSGENTFSAVKMVKQSNILSLLSSNVKIEAKLIGINKPFFQKDHLSNITYEYIRREDIKRNLINSNPFKNRFDNNNDIFLHIRLRDVKKYNPGLEYFKKTINKISNYDRIFIGTDEPMDRTIIRKLLSDYKNIELLDLDSIQTIQFGCTCKHLVVSHGTYSAIVSYMAYYSDIYYCCVDNNGWCPMELFHNKGFIPIKHPNEEEFNETVMRKCKKKNKINGNGIMTQEQREEIKRKLQYKI